MITTNDKLIFGTWELEQNYKNISATEAEKLIKFAKEIGVHSFDTALAYGNGEVERILGNVTDESDYIITKIPGITKPLLTDEQWEKYYTHEHIDKCLKLSLKNLKRERINCVLFHNWAYGWGKEPIEFLIKYKHLGLVEEIGISIPNNYMKELPKDVLDLVDVIEIPLNNDNLHNEKIIKYYKSLNKKVLIRSIFHKGENLGINRRYCCLEKIRKVQEFGCQLVIGMTSARQVQDNFFWTYDKSLLEEKVNNSIFDNDIILKGQDKSYTLNNVLFGSLSKDIEEPLHNVSVSNNSLSIDIWKGCSFRCKYCHVQGIYEDIKDEHRMGLRPCRRNNCDVRAVVKSLFSHPYFIPDETIISIGTSSTEPLAKGEVMESTIAIMKTFVEYGLKNPFWIVTKASLRNVPKSEIENIAKNGNKIMFSICYAGNPINIEPASNDRFLGVERFHDIENVFISWYMRPLVREWGANNDNLKKIVADISNRYGKYIDYIVPGGMRWTEGVEYGLCEINKELLPDLQKCDNKKTLGSDIIDTINRLCKKYFNGIEVFYNSSCPLSRMLGKDNINISQVVKNNCPCSICNHRCRAYNIEEYITQFNDFLSSRGFSCQLIGVDEKNKILLTKPQFRKLHYVEQQIIKQFLAGFLYECEIK